jgi:hypothetical protein
MLGSYGVRRRTRDGRLVVETWGCGVEISVDGGETWREAALGNDLGRFDRSKSWCGCMWHRKRRSMKRCRRNE